MLMFSDCVTVGVSETICGIPSACSVIGEVNVSALRISYDSVSMKKVKLTKVILK